MIKKQLIYVNPLNQEFDFGAYPFSISEVSGLYAPKFSAQTQKSPGIAGNKYISSNIDDRTITITGGIVSQFSESEIYDAKRAISHQLSAEQNDLYGLGVLKYTENGITRLLDVYIDQVEIPTTYRKNGGQPFSITFVAPYPYWRCDTDTETTIETTVDLFSVVSGGSIGIPSGGIAFSSTFVGTPIDVLNQGDTVSYPVITFYGPAVNPKIENLTTGEFVLLDKTLIGTDIMIIDCFNKTVLINGTVNGNQYLNITSTFFGLNIGINSVRFTTSDSSTSARCSLRYCDKFIGV